MTRLTQIKSRLEKATRGPKANYGAWENNQICIRRDAYEHIFQLMFHDGPWLITHLEKAIEMAEFYEDRKRYRAPLALERGGVVHDWGTKARDFLRLLNDEKDIS